VGAGQRLRAAELDAVTVDAYGTLVELVDPVPALASALRDRGVARQPGAVRAAFAAEVAYYVPRSHEGRDEESLADLRRRCVDVFLAELDAAIDAAEFVPAFVGALEFRALAGAREAVAALAGRGLALSVLANWDCTLERRLEQLGLSAAFAEVVTSARAGVAKPDPGIFAGALEQLGIEPERSLHVGDGDVDRVGATAAGMRFAPAPLTAVVAALA
jgi:putative hydrolase of the HAD superfamily